MNLIGVSVARCMSFFQAGFILTGVAQAKVFAQLLFPKVRYIARVFILLYCMFCCVNNYSLLRTPVYCRARQVC